MLDAISKQAERAIQEKVFPGCVVGFVKKNGERNILPFGHFTYDADAAPVRQDTIYDVASITKAIPTTSLALLLIDQGKIKTTDKLIDYIPEFNNSDRERVLIKHLLTYTLDGYGLASAVDGVVLMARRCTKEHLQTFCTLFLHMILNAARVRCLSTQTFLPHYLVWL